MKKFFVLSIFLTCSFPVYSQWASVYTNEGLDFSYGIITFGGYTYVAGSTWSGADLENNGLLIKYNGQGDSVWVKQFNGATSGEDFFYYSLTDRQNNIILAGESESTTNYDMLTAKYDLNGNLLWRSLYNGNANGVDEALYAGVDDSSNIYVTGYTKQTSNYNVFTTLKYNPGGVQQWVKNYFGDSIGNNTPRGIKVAPLTGNVYVTGFINTQNHGRDIVVLKYNRNGNLVWVKRINDSLNGDDNVTSIAIDANENVFIAGYMVNTAPNNTDIVIAKYSPNGDSLWMRFYTNTSVSQDISSYITVDNSGNSYVSGESIVTPGGQTSKMVTICYDSSGVQKWVSEYNNEAACCYHSPVKSMLDGNAYLYVCGRSDRSIINTDDFALIKYSVQTGQEIGAYRYRFSGSLKNEPSSMTIDSVSNIYITGLVSYADSIKIGTIMVPAGAIGIKRISEYVPQRFQLYQNYPNPFNPETKIKFDIPTPLNPPFMKGGNRRSPVGFVKLVVYDILGREAAVIVDQQLQSGSYEVSWDASKYASGIYYYMLHAGDYTEARKMILLK